MLSHADKARQSKLLGNRAECALRLGNYETALADCEESLSLDPTNAKSSARKAKAEAALAEAAEKAAK
eukprot:COSAG01_NODE_52249_length_348_cov_0.614458_1_plen_67_part_01